MSDQENAFGELIHEYLAECVPLAEEAADGLLELERRWKKGADAGDLAAKVKGVIHTIKGNSAMMGFRPIADLSHGLEDHLAMLLADEARRDRDGLDLLLEGGNLLVELVRTAATGNDDTTAAAWVAEVRAASGDRDIATTREALPQAGRRAEDALATVRVDFRRLDALQEILGEAMIGHARLRDVQRQLRSAGLPASALADLDAAIDAVETTGRRLEDAVMATRLVPVSGAFARFARRVRDVAASVGREVRLETAGGDARLDKAVVDRLGEPLLHLITNAVVHGIEPAHVREAAGKPREGVIRLSALTAGDAVLIAVADDGRGLDADRIAAKARALGIEPPSDAAAIYPLVFTPGLSTADQVSSLAGRGIGLDVVAGSLHALGGTITVDSRPGEGTRFVMRVPVTLAVVRTLLVAINDEQYAIPLAHVAETVRVAADDIHQLNQRGVVLWRGELLPVVDGGALVGAAESPATRTFNVVVQAGPRRRGVLVDRLLGHGAMVSKGLDPLLGRTRLISGTTIMGDGRITCILDAQHLVDPASGLAAATT